MGRTKTPINKKTTEKNRGKIKSESLHYPSMHPLRKHNTLQKLLHLEEERNTLNRQINAWRDRPDLFSEFINDAEKRLVDNYRSESQIDQRRSIIEKLENDLNIQYKDLETPLGHNISPSKSIFTHSDKDISPLSVNSRGGKSNRKTKRMKPKRKSIKNK